MEADGALTAEGPSHRVTLSDDSVHFRSRDDDWTIRVRGPHLRLGQTRLEPSAGRALEVDTATRRLPHGVEERATNGPDGVAFSWHFSEPFDGPAVASLSLDRHELHETSDEGLTLRTPDRERGLFVTHAVWIDADERRTEIPAQWRDGAIEFRVAAELVARSTFPAVLDPTIGPELFNPPSISSGTDAPGEQWEPAACVSSDGLTALFVWADSRRWGEPTAIYGARVSHSGGVSDRVGLHLGAVTSAETTVAPSCATAAGGFQVAWVAGGSVTERYLPRFGDPAPTGTWGADAGRVWVSSKGGARGVLVQSRPTGGTVTLAIRRFAANGSPVDAAPLTIATGVTLTSTPTLTATSSSYVVAWSEEDAGGTTRVHVSAVPATGAASPTRSELVRADVIDLTSASDGTNALIAWNTASEGIRGHKVAADGTPIGVAASLTRGATDSMPRLAHSTDGYHLVWRTAGSSFFYKGVVAPASAPGLVTEVLLDRTTTANPYLAVGGHGDLAVMAYQDQEADHPYLGKGIWSLRIDDNAFVGSYYWLPEKTSTAAPATYLAQVEWGTTRYGLVYRGSLYDTSWDSPQVLGRMIGPDGTGGFGSFRVRARRNHEIEDRYEYRIASSETDFMVIFTDRILGGSVSLEAAVIPEMSASPTGFTVDQYSVTGEVVTHPSGRDVDVFYRSGSSIARRTVSATRTVSAEATVASARSDAGYLRADRGLITWWSPSLREVGTKRYSPSRTQSAIPITTYNLFEPAVAGSGTSYLYVWVEDAPSTPARVFAQRLSADGSPAGSRMLLADADHPDVTWTGSEFLVVMEIGDEVGAVRISAEGVLLDETPAILTDDVGPPARRPSVDSDERRRALVSYERMMDEAGSMQVQARIVDLAAPGTEPLGAACENGWSCASGYCADGVCCSAPCTGACDVCLASEGASADGTCTPRAAGTECRAAEGVCDVAEACDGTSSECPADGVAAAGVACGEATPQGPCDVADSCNGASKVCSTSGRVAAGTVCRAAVGPCDEPEVCSGSSVECPADAFATDGRTCRPASGACDVEERCDGTGSACPSDQVRAADYTCRRPTGSCDTAELCDGTSRTCPSDGFRGTSHVCRPSGGACDPEERCTGTGPGCPADDRLAVGTVCRPSEGTCDPEEVCGSEPECPEDQLVAHGTICRNASGPCDIAETCDGVSPDCSPNRFQRDGLSCDDGSQCDGLSTCQAGACVSGEPILCEAGQVCDERFAACVPEETASGCGCRVAGRRAVPRGAVPSGPVPRGAAWALALLGTLVWRRRRR